MEEIPQPQEGMNPEPTIEVEETITADETGETQPDATEETVPKSQFNQVLARAKAAEAKLKAQQPAKPAEAPKQINKPDVPSEELVQITVLKAQGMSQDRIDYLKKIAAINNTSIIDAQNDDLYKAYVQKKESEAKAQKASLGASRGSGTAKKEESFNTPGLSDEKFKELWKQKQGR